MTDRAAVFRDHLTRRPDDRFALYGLALELKKAGDRAAAEAAFADLLRQHPASGAGHYQLGRLRQEAGDAAGARAAWETGLIALRGVDDAEARRSLGEIRRALDELDDAET